MNLLPADTYIVENSSVLTEIERRVIINLYEPIIGSNSVSLYLTLWSDLDKMELISSNYTHHHLMTILKSDLDTIKLARESLEAVGLIKTYVKESDNINEYIYELFSPLSAYEFLNHPVLSVLLLNNIGEIEFNNIKRYYRKRSIPKVDYREITSSMNETFKVVESSKVIDDSIRKLNRLGINLDNNLDYDLIEASIPSGLLNAKALNKKTKELINQLAFVYNLDSIKMSNIIIASIDTVGLIDKEKLRQNARSNYQYNNSGDLPTLIYRTQPAYLKTPSGDTSNKGKIIYAFENTRPYDFLKLKNKNIEPTPRDLHILEHLAVDFMLPAGVINVLVDYTLKVNDGVLSKGYLETIASEFSRKGIKTVPDAMNTLIKNRNKVKTKSTKNVVKEPAWLNLNVAPEKMSDEEIEELQNMFEEFR
ncbi:MAG: DnaD domain protein [Bacilli bacterium]|nr:DnaD domain protein [Bacilli bacterium]